MKKLMTALVMLVAMASLTAQANQYAMISVVAPAQIPTAQEHLDGVRLDLIYGECLSMNGLDVGVFGRTRERFNGLQVAGCSIVGTDAAGHQIGLANFVDTGFYGAQFGLWNDVDGVVDGFQLGIVNQAGTLNGLQIGLLNFIDQPSPTWYCLPIVNFGW